MNGKHPVLQFPQIMGFPAFYFCIIFNLKHHFESVTLGSKDSKDALTASFVTGVTITRCVEIHRASVFEISIKRYVNIIYYYYFNVYF